MRLLKSFMTIVLALFMCLPSAASAAESKLVIIPMSDAGSARMTKPLLKHVIQPLGSQQTLVPYGQYRRTAKKAKVKLSQLDQKVAVDKVAKGMGITHLVTVHVKTDKIEAKLIDAATMGATQAWEITGALNADSGKSLVSKISEGLTAKPEAAAEAKPEAAAPAAAAEAKPEAAAPVAAAPAPAPAPEAKPAATEEAKPEAAAPAAAEEAKPEAAAPAAAEETKPKAEEAKPEEAAPAEEVQTYYTENRDRPNIYASIGFAGLSRNAKLNDKASDSVNSVSGNTGGFVPSLAVDLEAYPLAFFDVGPWWIQLLGLHAEGLWSASVSWSDQGQTYKSSFTEVKLGVSYRFVLWDDKAAPHATLKTGFAMLEYPNASSFPGARYSSPYLGLEGEYALPFELPLVDSLSVQGGLNYYLAPSVEGGVSQLGENLSKSLFGATFGAKIALDSYFVQLEGTFQSGSLDYQGPYNSSTGKLYQSPAFAESNLGGKILVGMSF